MGCILFLALSSKINFLLKGQETSLFLYRPTDLVREVFLFLLLFPVGMVNAASPEDYLFSPPLIAADYSTGLGMYDREFAKRRGVILFPSYSWPPSLHPILEQGMGELGIRRGGISKYLAIGE